MKPGDSVQWEGDEWTLVVYRRQENAAVLRRFVGKRPEIRSEIIVAPFDRLEDKERDKERNQKIIDAVLRRPIRPRCVRWQGKYWVLMDVRAGIAVIKNAEGYLLALPVEQLLL